MKTAGTENQNRYAIVLLASRVCGTEGRNNPAPWGGLDVKKASGHWRSVFFLTPFIELIGSYKELSASGPKTEALEPTSASVKCFSLFGLADAIGRVRLPMSDRLVARQT